MAELSQNELKAIRSHPLENGLQAFRTKNLESANVTEVVERLTSEALDGSKKARSPF